MYTCGIKAHNIILKWRSRQFHVHCTYRAYALGECNGLWWLTFALGWSGNLEFCRKVICWEAIYFLHRFCLQTQTKTKPKKEPGTRLSSVERQKMGWGRGKGWRSLETCLWWSAIPWYQTTWLSDFFVFVEFFSPFPPLWRLVPDYQKSCICYCSKLNSGN